MTMTTGEFDFDIIFRQNPTGESDAAAEVPFSTVSYILWMLFIVLMPVLLTNMLVSTHPDLYVSYDFFLWFSALPV